MTKKKPPFSVRLSDANLKLVDAYAYKEGVSRHAMVVALVEAGLKVKGEADEGDDF